MYSYNNNTVNSLFNNQVNKQLNYQIEYGVNRNQTTNNNLFQNQKNINSIENVIYSEISQSEHKVLSKKEIANRYDMITNKINNMILGPNFIVTIQNKWNESIPSQNDIMNFIESTKKIGRLENKCYLGIFISKLHVSSDIQYIFEYENLSSINRFISIHSNMQSQITYELKKILYAYRIYYFESDGSVIMLD